MTETPSIDRRKTAVVIMDYQYRQLSNFPVPFQNELISRANKVMDAARAAGIPVIHVEVQRGEPTPETAIHKSVLMIPGEPLLTKKRVGPFSTTNMMSY